MGSRRTKNFVSIVGAPLSMNIIFSIYKKKSIKNYFFLLQIDSYSLKLIG